MRRVDPLFVQRATLCDLLIGRWLRKRANEVLLRGLEIEPLGENVDYHINNAARLEQIAEQAELGIVLWGGRIARDGRTPEDF
jgi:hypothetical protein